MEFGFSLIAKHSSKIYMADAQMLLKEVYNDFTAESAGAFMLAAFFYPYTDPNSIFHYSHAWNLAKVVCKLFLINCHVFTC